MYGFATIFGTCTGKVGLGRWLNLVPFWLCAFFAFSPALMADSDYCYLSEDEVFELWNDFCSGYDPELASRCHSAEDYYKETGEGFRGEWGEVAGPVNISGEFIVSNGLCFVSAFPVAIIDNYTHPPFLEESVSQFPVPGSDLLLPETSWNSSLIASIWASPYDNFSRYAHYYTPFLASNSFVRPTLTNQPHGRVVSSGFRVSWSNVYLSMFLPYVRYAPFWWASTGDCRVNEDVFNSITGYEWPWTNTYIRITRDMAQGMIKNAHWRILERWR